MRRIRLIAALALALLPGSARADDLSRGADLEGLWRILPVGRGDPGGLLRVERRNGLLRYERRTRLLTTGPIELERGLIDPRAGLLRTVSSARQGLTDELGLGRDLAPVLGRYVRQGPGWIGRRGQATRGGERWVPGSDADQNSVRLLVDGREAFPAIYQALLTAQRSIELQTYMYADDETGRRVGEILMAKARAGVRVRVMVDTASSMSHQGVSAGFKKAKRDWNGWRFDHGVPTGKAKGLRAELREAGAEVITQHGFMKGLVEPVRRVFDWFRGKRRAERRGFFNHDHRKVIVVDDLIAFTGGMNIGVEYETEFHDIHCRVIGPAAHDLHRTFMERWRAAGGHGDDDPAPQVEWRGDAPVEVVGSVPGVSLAILERYLHEIEAARERIQIEVAYFLDDRIIDALQRAVRRGVRVVLIIPADEKNDVIPVREAFNAVKNEVVRAGIELWHFQPTLTHAKVAAFDGRVATVGSANLDPLALNELSELNVFVPDPRFARELEERVFARDLPRSRRAQVQQLSWWRRLVGGLFRAFKGIL